LPKPPSNRPASRAWIFRLALGVALIGLSLWGIPLCNGLFHQFVGPNSLPSDASFENLGARVAWLLFFGPLAAAGLATVWSTLRKVGALEQFASWLAARGGHSQELPANDPPGVETLSPETVYRLQHTAERTAVILGGLIGTSLLGIGIFGLVSLLFFSQPYPGSSVYMSLATGRIVTYFAVASGMSVLLGLAILQRTFRKENGGWLLPLRIFTYVLLRRRGAGQPGRRAESTNEPPLAR
jgi:hypothetical protein